MPLYECLNGLAICRDRAKRSRGLKLGDTDATGSCWPDVAIERAKRLQGLKLEGADQRDQEHVAIERSDRED